MNAVTVEVGKFYVLANGERIGPMKYTDFNDGYPFHADATLGYWSVSGERQRKYEREDTRIVSEWVDPAKVTGKYRTNAGTPPVLPEGSRVEVIFRGALSNRVDEVGAFNWSLHLPEEDSDILLYSLVPEHKVNIQLTELQAKRLKALCNIVVGRDQTARGSISQVWNMLDNLGVESENFAILPAGCVIGSVIDDCRVFVKYTDKE